MTAAIVGGVLFAAGAASAQQPAPYLPDVIPEKLAFTTPYGAPITLERARAVTQAAIAEATKRGWPINVAIFDSGGNMVSFERMDGAQLGSIAIAEHKARAAVKFRRPTKVFEFGIQKAGYNYLLTLVPDDLVASRGGIPLIENGKLIGAIGVSGGDTGSQDEVVATAGAAVVNK